MKLLITIIPEEIIQAYNLENLQDKKVWIYIKITKRIYALKQAGIIANQELQKHMATYGYRPVRFTPVLWKHDEKDAILSLVVDDFLVQYTSEENVAHFLHALCQKYEATVGRKAQKYIGISLEWDYNKRTVQLFMPDYVKQALHKLRHFLPTRLEYP